MKTFTNPAWIIKTRRREERAIQLHARPGTRRVKAWTKWERVKTCYSRDAAAWTVQDYRTRRDASGETSADREYSVFHYGKRLAL